MTGRSVRMVPRGLAYMVAHGHAADGSHADNTEPTQHLVNPPHHNPTRRDVVDAWVHLRAQRADPLTAAAKPAEPPAVAPEAISPGRDDQQAPDGEQAADRPTHDRRHDR